MEIRPISPQDNAAVETLIRTCLLEFGANKPGCAWEDKTLGCFSEVYSAPCSAYWVAVENGNIAAGCGIGPIAGAPGVCELQKMYAYPAARGTGIAAQMLSLALSFARTHYKSCYLETFSSMTAANRFYQKHGFVRLERPLVESEHYACDVWYLMNFDSPINTL